jgi:protein translocase SecG subunit|uniref:Probable protein-export membrane protein SecG n=1 Tax=Acanthoceras zachariasii TaxID=451788 RepID=A0A2U9NUH9_9STRA|nr:preprotein translocase SecG subunit [Acanthoceras zachariasii]AWT40466.1 preprotein translocase SecG subunit [Acanthoceras zachariasii]
MLNVIWLLLSCFLIFIIFLRAPQSSGLSSFATKTNILGSPSSAERFLNNLTAIAIFAYVLIAIQLNFNNLIN